MGHCCSSHGILCMDRQFCHTKYHSTWCSSHSHLLHMMQYIQTSQTMHPLWNAKGWEVLHCISITVHKFFLFKTESVHLRLAKSSFASSISSGVSALAALTSARSTSHPCMMIICEKRSSGVWYNIARVLCFSRFMITLNVVNMKGSVIEKSIWLQQVFEISREFTLSVMFQGDNENLSYLRKVLPVPSLLCHFSSPSHSTVKAGFLKEVNYFLIYLSTKQRLSFFISVGVPPKIVHFMNTFLQEKSLCFSVETSFTKCSPTNQN